MSFGLKVRNSLNGLNYSRCKHLISRARSADDGKPINKSIRIVQLCTEPEPIYALRLYSTHVMTFYPDNRVAVTLGGFDTVTTLSVINTASKHFRVGRSKHGWYVIYNIPKLGGDPRDIRAVMHYATDSRDTFTLPVDPRSGRHPVKRTDGCSYRSYLSPQLLGAPTMRKVAKSRKMVNDPKVGDVFRYNGKEYIVLESRAGLVAEPYHGDRPDLRCRVVRPDDVALEMDFNNDMVRLLLPTTEVEQIERYAVEEQPWNT